MQIWLSQDVIDKIIAKLYAQPPKKGGTGTGDKNPPGAGGDTPPDEPGPAPQPGATPGEKPDTPPKEPGEPGKEGGERKKPLPPGATGQKGGAEPTGEEIKTREGGKKGGTGTGTEPGSKYGWLGWLKLPQDVIDALEAAFEALGDSEEYQALSELLNLLKDLGDYIDEVKSWFKDTDKLLAAVLGLEKSKTIDKLEEWVERPAKKRKATPGAKGIVGIALKVANIIEKIRRLLKPVFIARDAFVKVLGVVGLVVEGVPALENLLSATKKELQTTSFRDLTVQVATDIAASLQAHLLDARKSFKLVLERFTKDDLISREMIASAVTRAALKMVKHPVVKLASKIPGLDDLVSDNLVAPLIPDQALEAINGTIKEFAGDVIKTVRDAVKADLDKIFATSEQAITDFLIDHLPSLVAQPSAKAPAASRSAVGYAGQRAERLVQASTGGPLDGDLADAFASHMGYGVGHVRVHCDAASQEASELLQANAFTVGRDIYFGPGQFAPESSAGRRLLAHELMHVVQQDGSGADVQPGLVQRDFKGLQKKLVALFGDKVLDLLKVARAPSKKKEKRAGEIRDQIEKLRGRKVVSETNPALPEAYIYVTDKRKKIKGIRRLLAWIRYVPPLTIKRNGRIELGGVFNAFDPKAAARAQLRRALGCRSTQEAHHVIPLELRDDFEIVKKAEAKGWKFNGADNGLCISNRIHSGSHPNYTEAVRQRLTALTRQFKGKLDSDAARAGLDDLVDELRAGLRKRRKKLD